MTRLSLYFLAISPILIATFWGVLYFPKIETNDSLFVFGGSGLADLGVRTPNELLFHQFEVKNPTRNFARIEMVKSSCRCLVVGDQSGTLTLEGQTLKPGETMPIEFGIDTEGLTNQVSGKLLLTIRFYRDDLFDASGALGEQKLLLEIVALIPGDIEATPAEVDFGRVNRDRFERLVNLIEINRKRDDVNWELIRVTDPIFTCEPNLQNDSIEVSLDKDQFESKSAGPISAYIEIAVNNSPQRKLFIPLEVDLVDMLTVEPPFWSFRKSDEKKIIRLAGLEQFVVTELTIGGKPVDLPKMAAAFKQELTVLLPTDVPGKGGVDLKVRFENSSESFIRKIGYFVLERD